MSGTAILGDAGILIGLIADRPTDNAGATKGRLYLATDAGAAGIVYRDNGATWDEYATILHLGSTATTAAAGNHTHTSAAISDFVEAVQDVLGAILGADSGDLDWTYDDAGNAISVVLKPTGITASSYVNPASITFDAKGRATAATAGLLHNLSAVVAPTTGDDSGDGYAIGSRWINTATDTEYVCTDASVGAAVWKQTTPGTAATDAADVTYDNTTSGLAATDVQAALDEIAAGSGGGGSSGVGEKLYLCNTYI